MEFDCENCGGKITAEHLKPGEECECGECGYRQSVPVKTPEGDTAGSGLLEGVTWMRILMMWGFITLLELAWIWPAQSHPANPKESHERLVWLVVGIILLVSGVLVTVIFSLCKRPKD